MSAAYEPLVFHVTTSSDIFEQVILPYEWEWCSEFKPDFFSYTTDNNY